MQFLITPPPKKTPVIVPEIFPKFLEEMYLLAMKLYLHILFIYRQH